MAKAQNKDFNAWLEKPVARKQSLTCQTCAYGTEVCDIIKQFMIARAEGKTKRSNRDLHDYLTDPQNGINYHLGDSALGTHMRRCERETYKAMRAGDLRTGLARGPSQIDAELKEVEHKKAKRKTTPRKTSRPKRKSTTRKVKKSS